MRLFALYAPYFEDILVSRYSTNLTLVWKLYVSCCLKWLRRCWSSLVSLFLQRPRVLMTDVALSSLSARLITPASQLVTSAMKSRTVPTALMSMAAVSLTPAAGLCSQSFFNTCRVCSSLSTLCCSHLSLVVVTKLLWNQALFARRRALLVVAVCENLKEMVHSRESFVRHLWTLPDPQNLVTLQPFCTLIMWLKPFLSAWHDTAPPSVISPPESIQAAQGLTVTFTCQAVGVPTPMISWRLNWGHIPSDSRWVKLIF